MISSKPIAYKLQHTAHTQVGTFLYSVDYPNHRATINHRPVSSSSSSFFPLSNLTTKERKRFIYASAVFRQGRDKSQITWPELFFLLLRLRFCSASLFFSFFSSIIFHVIYHLIGGNAICERVHTHTQRPKGKLLMLFGVPYLFISIRPVLIVSWICYRIIIIIIRNVTMCLISFLFGFFAFFFCFFGRDV